MGTTRVCAVERAAALLTPEAKPPWAPGTAWSAYRVCEAQAMHATGTVRGPDPRPPAPVQSSGPLCSPESESPHSTSVSGSFLHAWNTTHTSSPHSLPSNHLLRLMQLQGSPQQNSPVRPLPPGPWHGVGAGPLMPPAHCSRASDNLEGTVVPSPDGSSTPALGPTCPPDVRVRRWALWGPLGLEETLPLCPIEQSGEVDPAGTSLAAPAPTAGWLVRAFVGVMVGDGSQVAPHARDARSAPAIPGLEAPGHGGALTPTGSAEGAMVPALEQAA